MDETTGRDTTAPRGARTPHDATASHAGTPSHEVTTPHGATTPHAGTAPHDDPGYCDAGPDRAAGVPGPVGAPFAECVLCREPTEYPETTKGATLCPVCEWQEAQRSACSG
ncbi:hypothetical protein [Streptomyces sp. NPDC048111]|uniref:hypothetical protein n=1 Tax=Streptomyces sp. NPDC048111 TaxID=3365500 RepID=UPI0037210133